MSELTDTIVHIAYRFKPEGTDKYITAYLESSLVDVIIPKETQSAMLGATNMQEFCNALLSKINNERPLYQKADMYDQNRIYPEGKFLYESDTGKLKVGDGVTRYKFLSYFGYDSERDAEYEAKDYEVALTIVDDEGTEIRTVMPDTIAAFSAEDEPSSYDQDTYVLVDRIEPDEPEELESEPESSDLEG